MGVWEDDGVYQEREKRRGGSVSYKRTREREHLRTNIKYRVKFLLKDYKLVSEKISYLSEDLYKRNNIKVF